MVKKHILDVTDEIWKDVLTFKIRNSYKKNNDALLRLIEIGLKNSN